MYILIKYTVPLNYNDIGYECAWPKGGGYQFQNIEIKI